MDESLPASLEHPLPAGMRDLLPEEAASRRSIARAALGRFALHGYRLVTPPAFELADVVERGLGRLTARDVLRFIEPESGEVVVLRPDTTPQVARIVATRLGDRPPPYRISYEGTVIRRRLGRAKKHRQIPQVGVELCGAAGLEGDLELLDLAVASVRATGLERFTLELADAGIQIIFSWPGIVLATVFVSLPFVAREVAPVLREIGDDQEQAAATLGANRWQIFWRITLPAIRWGVAYGVVLTTARAIGEFGAVSVVSGHIQGSWPWSRSSPCSP